MSGFSPAMMKVFMGEDADAEEETMGDDMVMVDEQGEETKPTPQKQEMTPFFIMMMKKALGETLHATYNRIYTTCSVVFVLQMQPFPRRHTCGEHELELLGKQVTSVLYF